MTEIYQDPIGQDYHVSYCIEQGDHLSSLVRDSNWEWYEVDIKEDKVEVSRMSDRAPENPTIKLDRDGKISPLIERIKSVGNPGHKDISSKVDLYETFFYK